MKKESELTEFDGDFIARGESPVRPLKEAIEESKTTRRFWPAFQAARRVLGFEGTPVDADAVELARLTLSYLSFLNRIQTGGYARRPEEGKKKLMKRADAVLRKIDRLGILDRDNHG